MIPKPTYNPPTPKAELAQAVPVKFFAVQLKGVTGKPERYLALQLGDIFYAFPGGEQFMSSFAPFADDMQASLRRATSSGQATPDTVDIPTRDAVEVL